MIVKDDNMSDKDYLVYVHRNKEGKVKYVGMGKKHRPQDVNKRSSVWNEYFKDTHFYPEVVKKGLTEAEALKEEKYLYYYYEEKGNQLLNSYRGIGFGGNAYKNLTEEELNEVKRKIGQSNMGDRNGNKGQYVGDKNSMYGKRSPIRKTYEVKNIKTNEVVILDSRNKMWNFLKDYRKKKYNDIGKAKNLSHDINNINIAEFCAGRINKLDDYILVNVTRECDLNKKV